MKTKNTFCRAVLILSLAIFITSGTQAQYGAHYFGRGYRSYGYSRPYISIGLGAYGYYGGAYYRPYYSYAPFISPAFGLRIGVLPFGYSTIYVGPDMYYYYNGTYYRPYDRNEYEVTPPPLGATVPKLPKGAKVVVIDGLKYYELNGTYYKEEVNDKNQTWYTVVGTNGVLNTDNTPAPGDQAGDRVDRLPENSRSVEINGQKYYVAPSGVYYQQITENNKTYYEVVGNSSGQR